MDYSIGIKYPYRRHRYVLQNVLILQAVQVTLYTMENYSPSWEMQAPQWTDTRQLRLQVYCGL